MFDTHNGMINTEDFKKIKLAQKILGECIWNYPTCGEVHDGKSYCPVDVLEDRKDVMKAINIIMNIYNITNEELEIARKVLE